MLNEQTKERIESLIGSHRVFLFMKGTPDFPQCGFSQRAVGILRAVDTDFGSFDILSDDGIRAGLKEYSNWPTFPQLYVNRELVGGSDIMMQLWEQGELEKMIHGA